MVFRALLFLGLAAVGLAGQPPDWNRVVVAPMKTSIYVGSVQLTTGEFSRQGELFTTTYEAKVRPWFFWSEHGQIAITVPGAELARLAAGERIEFSGEARNHRQQPRRVTGQAQAAGASSASGRIKVRIHVDGLELVFNGAYRIQ